MKKKKQAKYVGSLGLATLFTLIGGGLSSCHTWMGISTSKKTYPDDMVVCFSEWASQCSDHFYLLIASRMQLYNKVPFSSKSWDKLESSEYLKLAEERKARLQELTAGLDNVEVKLMEHEFIPELEARSDYDAFAVNYGAQLMNHIRFDDPDSSLDSAIQEVTIKRAGHLLERAEEAGINPAHALFAMSCYTQEEIFFSLLLAELGIAPIKIGPLWEREYDKLTHNLIEGKYGDIKLGKCEEFGAIYLK